jgi:putative addiction module killer protein
VKLRTLRLPEFEDWFCDQDAKGRAQIDARILRVETEGHFGDAKDLGDGLAELRWKNGRRVYFAKVRDSAGVFVLLVLGGNKNGQSKDIRQARVELKSGVKLVKHDASKALGDVELVSDALIQALKDGDAEAFKEVLAAHLKVANKEAFSAKAKIPKRTLFRMLTPDGNPTLDNIARIVHALSKAA